MRIRNPGFRTLYRTQADPPVGEVVVRVKHEAGHVGVGSRYRQHLAQHQSHYNNLYKGGNLS